MTNDLNRLAGECRIVSGMLAMGERIAFGRDADLLARAADLLDQAAAQRKELVEALEDLRISAALLQQNAEGCAFNHYGNEVELNGLPGWLSDTKDSIDRARALLSPSPETQELEMAGNGRGLR